MVILKYGFFIMLFIAVFFGAQAYIYKNKVTTLENAKSRLERENDELETVIEQQNKTIEEWNAKQVAASKQIEKLRKMAVSSPCYDTRLPDTVIAILRKSEN